MDIDIPRFEGHYQINENAMVYSVPRLSRQGREIGGHFLKPTRNGKDKKSLSVCLVNKQGKRQTFSLGVLMMMAYKGFEPNGHVSVVDHIDNDESNNKLSNLQIIPQRENASKDRKNKTSKYTGVSWDSSRGKWRAQIHIKGKTYALGRFDIEEDARDAYNNKLNQIK